MQRKTLTEQLRESNVQLGIAHATIQAQSDRIANLTRDLSFHRTTERRFDQLLEGMCMAMREGTLPRRTHG
jgi:hypothetical protein